MKNLIYYLKTLSFMGFLVIFSSCSNEEAFVDSNENLNSQTNSTQKQDNSVIFKGPNVTFYNGKIRSWVSVSKETGLPLEIGIEMNEASLEDLPHFDGEGPTFVVPLHQKAKDLTPFDHIGIHWQPHGHGGGPTNTEFTAEHFDIHFYTIPLEERLTIPDWSPESNTAFNTYPPTGYLPANYATPPGSLGCIGQMGKHWFPVPFNYLPFDKVLLYGTYNSKVVFLEPMVTLDFINSTNYFSDDFTQPLYFENEGNYPTKYKVYKDTKTGSTHITLSDFVFKQAGN